MTDYQISEILFHPRDNEGRLDTRPRGGQATSFKKICFETYDAHGIPEWEWEEKFKAAYLGYAGG